MTTKLINKMDANMSLKVLVPEKFEDATTVISLNSKNRQYNGRQN